MSIQPGPDSPETSDLPRDVIDSRGDMVQEPHPTVDKAVARRVGAAAATRIVSALCPYRSHGYDDLTTDGTHAVES